MASAQPQQHRDRFSKSIGPSRVARGVRLLARAAGAVGRARLFFFASDAAGRGRASWRASPPALLIFLLGLAGCQTSSLVLPDGTRFDRSALGSKLEVAELDFAKTATGYSGHVKGLSSDASQGLAAAVELAKAAAAIAAKGGVP